MYTQIYRCVLLNNGLRRQPQPDSSSSSSLTPEEGASAEGNCTSLVSGAPQDQRSDIAIGSRGDIIMFYNKVFISLIKNYALKFTPGENEVGFHPLLTVYLECVVCCTCNTLPFSLSPPLYSLLHSLLCQPYARRLPHPADSPDNTPSLCPHIRVSTARALAHRNS